MIRIPWKRAVLATMLTLLAVIGLFELLSISGEWLPKVREVLTRNPVPVYTASNASSAPSQETGDSATGSTSTAGPPTDPAAPEQPPFTLAWISDTQLYSESYPEIFSP